MNTKNEKIVSLCCPVCLKQLTRPLTESPCPFCNSDMPSILKPCDAIKKGEKTLAPMLFLTSSGKQAMTFDPETPASAIFAETPEKSFEHFWIKTLLSKMAGKFIPQENLVPETMPLLRGFHLIPADYIKELEYHIESLLYLNASILPLKNDYDKAGCSELELVSTKTEYVSDEYCIVKGIVKIKSYYNKMGKNNWVYVGSGDVYLNITMPFVKIENKWIATDVTPSFVAVLPTEEEKNIVEKFLVNAALDKQKMKEKKAKRKQIIKKGTYISIGVVTALVLLMLPYAITKSDGFFRIIAQPSMFISMLLCYLFLGIAFLACITLVFGGLGNAISGSSSDVMGYSFVVVLICGGIYFGLSALLMNLSYINPFTGVPFIRPF